MRIHFARPLLAHIKREFCLLFSAWKPQTQEVEFYWPIQNPKFLGWRWCRILIGLIWSSMPSLDAKAIVWLVWFKVISRAWAHRSPSDWLIRPFLFFTWEGVCILDSDWSTICIFLSKRPHCERKVSSGLTVIVEASFGDMTLYGSKLFRTNYSMFFCPSYCLFYILPMKKSLYDNKNVGPLSAVERFLSEQCTYVSEQCTSKYISISYCCKAAYLSYVYRLICVRLEQYVYWTLIFYPDNFTLILKWDQIRSKNGGTEEGELEKDQNCTTCKYIYEFI